MKTITFLRRLSRALLLSVANLAGLAILLAIITAMEVILAGPVLVVLGILGLPSTLLPLVVIPLVLLILLVVGLLILDYWKER